MASDKNVKLLERLRGGYHPTEAEVYISRESIWSVIAALKNNCRLNSLRFISIQAHNYVFSSLAHEIKQLLQAQNSVTSLSFDNMAMRPDFLLILKEILEQNTNLQSLTLKNIIPASTDSDAYAEAIRFMLQPASSIIDLTLSIKDSKVLHEGFLQGLFAISSRLRNLTLEQCSFDANGLEFLANCIKTNSLVTDSISINNIDPSLSNSTEKLMAALGQNNLLRTFNLFSNDFRVEQANNLAVSLRQNNSLTSLSLGKCHFAQDDIGQIADALVENTSIETFSLNTNNLDNAALLALANLIQNNHRLLQICVVKDGDKLTPSNPAAKALFKSLASRDDLRAVEVGNLNLTNFAIPVVRFFLSLGRLRRLNLQFCDLDVGAISVLARVLENNTSIQHLDLRNNNLNSCALNQLETMLKFNYSLKSLRACEETEVNDYNKVDCVARIDGQIELNNYMRKYEYNKIVIMTLLMRNICEESLWYLFPMELLQEIFVQVRSDYASINSTENPSFTSIHLFPDINPYKKSIVSWHIKKIHNLTPEQVKQALSSFVHASRYKLDNDFYSISQTFLVCTSNLIYKSEDRRIQMMALDILIKLTACINIDDLRLLLKNTQGNSLQYLAEIILSKDTTKFTDEKVLSFIQSRALDVFSTDDEQLQSFYTNANSLGIEFQLDQLEDTRNDLQTRKAQAPECRIA